MKGLILIFWLFIISSVSGQEIFMDEKFGFSMEQPRGWVSNLNVKHYFNLDRNEGENLLTLYKYKRGTGDINPMINVSVEHFNSKRDKLIKRLLNKYSWKEDYYINHQIIKQPELLTINGNTAITGTVHFKYHSHGTKKSSFRKRIYYIFNETYLFKIVFIDDYNTELNTPLFDSITQSIMIKKAL